MNRLQLLTATRILEHTMPVTSRRLLIYGAITIGLLFAVLAGAGTFFGLASLSDDPGLWGRIGAVLGLMAAMYGLHVAKPHLFYHLEALQWAAVAMRIEGESLPAGREQLDFLRNRVQALFTNAKEAFSLRCRLQEAITELALQLPPGDRFGALPRSLARGLVRVLTGFVTDAVMAVILQRRDRTAWRPALAAFCQDYPTVFRHVLLAKAFLYAMLIASFWVLLKPVGWVDDALPTDLGVWKYVFAAILTYWIKAAFLDPIITAALTLTLIPLAREADEGVLAEWLPRIPTLSRLPAS